MNTSKKFFSKIGLNYLTLGIISLISQIIIINLLYITNSSYLNNINITTLITSLCTYIIPFPIFYWLMKKIETQKIEKRKTDLKTKIIYIGITFTLMWIGNIIGLLITNLLSSVIHTNIENPIQQLINSTDIWFNIVIISIMAPIFEEILFRKLLIDRCIKYGAGVSILLSALIFAFFHGNLNQFFYAFLLGGFFAYVYIKTGKTTYTISLHILANIIGSVVSLIFSQSLMNLQTLLDMIIVISYPCIIFTLLIIGIIGIIKLRNDIFKKIEQPLKNIFLNYGMILFLIFFTFQIVYQMLR